MRRRRRLDRGRCKSQSADVRRVTIEAAATRFHYYTTIEARSRPAVN